MIKALIRTRFQALFAGLTRQGRQKNASGKKKAGKGTVLLLAVLYLYVAVVLCGAMGFLFWTLSAPYHALGLDWLYFSMAGTMGLGFAVIGSVFTTQSQLYDAKDNDMLLAMPIPPSRILLSRMIPLLAMNLLFSGIVMVPAIVVYTITVQFSLAGILLQLFSLIAVSLLAQAIACLLGWLLHLLLSRMNKSIAAALYTVVFLGLYFTIYPRMNGVLASLAANGEAIAGTMQSWVWPMYAMGRGALGSFGFFLAFAAICCGVFALIYWLLSVTFLRTATVRRGSKRRKLDMGSTKTGNAGQAIVRKELHRFLGSPVYLTNMGIGLLLMPAIAIAGVIFRDRLLSEMGPLAAMLSPYFPLIICGILISTSSMSCISAPSVSLEGKNLWILKAMPVSAKQILLSKLRFHCVMSAPIAALSGCVLSIAFGCGLADILLCTLVPAAMMIVSGLLGLICNLKWPRFDWLSEAYPCKQAASVGIVLLSLMGIPVVLGIGYFLLSRFLSPTAFLGIVAALFLLSIVLLYRVLITWGAKKWDSF